MPCRCHSYHVPGDGTGPRESCQGMRHRWPLSTDQTSGLIGQRQRQADAPWLDPSPSGRPGATATASTRSLSRAWEAIARCTLRLCARRSTRRSSAWVSCGQGLMRSAKMPSSIAKRAGSSARHSVMQATSSSDSTSSGSSRSPPRVARSDPIADADTGRDHAAEHQQPGFVGGPRPAPRRVRRRQRRRRIPPLSPRAEQRAEGDCRVPSAKSMSMSSGSRQLHPGGRVAVRSAAVATGHRIRVCASVFLKTHPVPLPFRRAVLWDLALPI